MRIDLSLRNSWLYSGCEIEEVNGRLNLKTPIHEASKIVGRNIEQTLDESFIDFEQVTLTGAMAVWSYLIVYHAVLHRFKRVYYEDGKNEPLLIAAHG